MPIATNTKHVIDAGVGQKVFSGYCKKVPILGSSGLPGSTGVLGSGITYECSGQPILGSSAILGSSNLRSTQTVK